MLKQVTYFLLRLVAGLLIFQPGAMKMLGWYGGMPGAHGAMPPMFSQVWFAGLIEIVGGPLIMLGLLTRPVAFVLAGEMAVAYWQFHFPRGHWPLQNSGGPAVLLCFIFLYMAAEGAGPWSVDALLRRRA